MPAGPDSPDSGVWSWFTGALGGVVGLVTGAIGGTIGFLGSVVAAVVAGLEVTAARIGELWSYVSRGIDIVLGDLERLWYVFVRSGRTPSVNYAVNDQEAVELAVLEVAPVLGTLIAIAIVLARRAVRSGTTQYRQSLAAVRTTPRYQTDLFAGTLVVVFTLLYLPRLPLYSQITMRYLVPVMPVAAYGVIRLPGVRRGLESEFRQFLGGYTGATVIGTVGVILAFVVIDPAIGEAMQFHALVNLAVAGIVAVVVLADTVSSRDLPVAAAIGAVGGAGTTLYILAGIEYFTYGQFALPVATWLSAVIPIF